MAEISIIIPVHNEEEHLPSCLQAIRHAAEHAAVEPEVIIVLNRCTDNSEKIAREAGAVIVREEAANLSKIRNAGAAVASAPILITCDADSRPHPRTLQLVIQKLGRPGIIGGGTFTLPERWSVGILASIAAILPYLIWHRVSFGLFWCRRSDFQAIGGFNEDLVSVEDLDFAKRLRRHGARESRRFVTLWKAPLTTSCRKFDIFGDWYLFLHPLQVRRIFKGNDREVSDTYWYEARK